MKFLYQIRAALVTPDYKAVISKNPVLYSTEFVEPPPPPEQTSVVRHSWDRYFSLWTGMFRDAISSIPGETVIPLCLFGHFPVCENRVYHERVRMTVG